MQADPSTHPPPPEATAGRASHIEVAAWDAIALLRNSHVGRLCVLDHGTPIALPVNFKVVGRDAELRVVIRTSPTSLVGRYEGLASMEVDHIDEVRQRAWSVLARGLLRHAGGDSLPDPEPWIAGARHRWLVLEVRSISARRFTGSPSTQGFPVEWTLEPVEA